MAKEKSQGPITRALSKAKEFVKDKIYDCRVRIHNSIPKKNKEKTATMSSKAKKDLIFYIVIISSQYIFYYLLSIHPINFFFQYNNFLE